MPLHDAIGVNCEKSAPTDRYQSAGAWIAYGPWSERWMIVCELSEFA